MAAGGIEFWNNFTMNFGIIIITRVDKDFRQNFKFERENAVLSEKSQERFRVTKLGLENCFKIKRFWLDFFRVVVAVGTVIIDLQWSVFINLVHE